MRHVLTIVAIAVAVGGGCKRSGDGGKGGSSGAASSPGQQRDVSDRDSERQGVPGDAAESTREDTTKILLANVFSANRDASSLLELIESESPDVVVLLETTPRWMASLQALQADYPHELAVPRNDNFGIALGSVKDTLGNKRITWKDLDGRQQRIRLLVIEFVRINTTEFSNFAATSIVLRDEFPSKQVHVWRKAVDENWMFQVLCHSRGANIGKFVARL